MLKGRYGFFNKHFFIYRQKQMATVRALSEEELLCPLCCEVFEFPVILTCHHNFCKACIESRWQWKGSLRCPLCRRRASTRRPPINLALKIASDTFKKQASETEAQSEHLCSIHQEELKFFCQKDGKLICLVCHSSRDHRNHKCRPIAEVAADRKKELSEKYESLTKHLICIEKMKKDLEELKTYLQHQATQTEAQMSEEFEKLHTFLREEQAARVTVLQEEMARKTQLVTEKLNDVSQTAEDLSKILAEIEHTMHSDDTSFLKDCKEAIKRACYPIQEPEYPKDALIDVAQYLGSLKFGVWKRMEEMVKYYPIHLDPNTAQANLILTDEVTTVCYGNKQQVPDNPERCYSRLAVLGSVGFTSGKHCWDVEVGEGREWYIGVARESIGRKTTVFLNPGEGFWVIGLNNGETYWAQTAPRTRLQLKKKPLKITVELDYDKGKVSFISAPDGSNIYTFKDKFTEKMFPYFAPGIQAIGRNPLKICPLKASITLQSDACRRLHRTMSINQFSDRRSNSFDTK